MFKDRDVVCFLGDSITAKGLWIAEVYQYLRKKYKIKCYNCGVSGGKAHIAAQYLQNNCLIYNPDYVVIMFGVNDIERWLYSERFKAYSNREEILSKAMEKYKAAYEEIVTAVKASGAEPILCVPVPYDEVSDVSEENYHCQFALDECERFLRALAEKYGCPIVDFKSVIQPMLGESEVICPDRVHPTEYGYHIMAQVFLRDMSEKEDIEIDIPFAFEDWNKERYDAEQRLHGMNYVEFCDIFDDGWAMNKTYEEKKQIAREKYEKIEDKTTFVPQAYLSYIENIDNRDHFLGEVIKLTLF